MAALVALVAFATLALAPTPTAAAGTLDQVRQTGKLILGYRTDAAPFAYQTGANKAAGYTVTLCQQIADKVKTELGLASLSVEWVPVTLGDRFKDLQQGKVDLLCGADTATLSRMKEVAFSIPIFPGGVGAMSRADGDPQLRALLDDAPPLSHPIWRGSPARTFIEKKTFSVVKGTTAEAWLKDRLKDFEIDATVVPVANYEEGFQRVLDHRSDVLFGDRAILLEAAKRSSSQAVADRLFTYEPIAVGIRRGDDDLRILVDRTLSQLYRSPEITKLYATWFGKPGLATDIFYQLSGLPD